MFLQVDALGFIGRPLARFRERPFLALQFLLARSEVGQFGSLLRRRPSQRVLAWRELAQRMRIEFDPRLDPRLAAGSWRDENGHTWLDRAPKITLLPLVGHQRQPQPITWADQRALLPKLPDHLSRMALFVLNTGVHDDVVCSLGWEREIRIPELGISVFEVPRQHVKGKRRSKILVCNSVSQSVVESVRGMHEKFVFVYRRERVTNVTQAPAMAYRRIVNNSAWQRARKEADLGDLHVHDLRHTVGMRLREAGVPEGTRADILWHSTRSMTHHYSVAQIFELSQALEKVKDDNGRWNKSLLTLRREQEATRGN